MVIRIFANRNNKSGVTLVEIMVVIICLSIIIGPILTLLRSGSDTSLKGMMRVETTLKARRILQQIYADLKMACIRVDKQGGKYDFGNILLKGGSAPYYEYCFDSFPTHQKYEDIFNSSISNTEDNRKPSTIYYKVTDGDDPNLPLKKLIRYEIFNGKATTKVLTDRLNFFEIKEIGFQPDGKNQFYYLISLQLLDVLHAEDMKNKKSGERLKENQKDVILADFYDVVYPEHFNSLWNEPGSNLNWHTFLQKE